MAHPNSSGDAAKAHWKHERGFLRNFASVLIRLAAFWVLFEAHHLLDPRLVVVFPKDTYVGQAVLGGTQFVFFALYVTLMIDAVICFVKGLWKK